MVIDRGLLIVICVGFVSFCAMASGRQGASAFVGVEYLRSTSGGAHCGAYSLAGALKLIEIEPDLDLLLRRQLIGSEQGSSGKELIEAARASGATAYGFTRLSINSLKRLKYPVLLYLRESRLGDGTHHWVTFVCDQNGKALLYDPPQPIQPVDYATVMAFWTGAGIVVTPAHADFNPWSFAVADRMRVLHWLVGLAIVAAQVNRTLARPADSSVR
jgi:hypothetical protein